MSKFQVGDVTKLDWPMSRNYFLIIQVLDDHNYMAVSLGPIYPYNPGLFFHYEFVLITDILRD